MLNNGFLNKKCLRLIRTLWIIDSENFNIIWTVEYFKQSSGMRKIFLTNDAYNVTGICTAPGISSAGNSFD